MYVVFFTACTKDVYEPTKTIVKDSVVYVKDTIRIFNTDTVKMVIGNDTMKLNIVYSLSNGGTTLTPVDSSENVPSNAIYTWYSDDSKFGTGPRPGITSFGNSGTYLITMSVDLPTYNLVYNVVKSVVITVP